MFTLTIVFLGNFSQLVLATFVPSKCETLLQNWVCSMANLVHAEEVLNKVDVFCYSSDCISLGNQVSDKVSSCTQSNLWYQVNVWLSIPVQVWTTVLRTVVRQGSGISKLWIEDIRRLFVFQPCCLYRFVRIYWGNSTDNNEVEDRVFDSEFNV